jgi:uncharacterized protein
MFKRTLLKIVVPAALTAVLWLSGCNSADTSVAIEPTWITPEVNAGVVSIPVSAIEQYTMVHYWVDTPAGRQSFMAYKLNCTNYVRADDCVPCRSTSFSLDGDTLICDTCTTKFSAVTGKGVLENGCGAYPKEAVSFKTENGNLVMTVADLQAAYAATLKIG